MPSLQAVVVHRQVAFDFALVMTIAWDVRCEQQVDFQALLVPPSPSALTFCDSGQGLCTIASAAPLG